MKFKQNKSEANEVSKTHFEKSLAGLAIIVIIVLHFVSQFSFSQSENVAKIEARNLQSVEIKNELKKPAAVQIPEVAPATQAVEEAPAVVVQPEKPAEEAAAPTRTVIRKKEVKETRESKANRLRRLEKFLTGV